MAGTSRPPGGKSRGRRPTGQQTCTLTHTHTTTPPDANTDTHTESGRHSPIHPFTKVLRDADVADMACASFSGPVIDYMDDVIADLISRQGCAHSISQLQGMQGHVGEIIAELANISRSGRPLEMRTLTKLRTRFLTLSKDSVVEDGERRYEYGNNTVIQRPRRDPNMTMIKGGGNDTDFALCFHCLRGSDTALCLVFPLPSHRLRHRLCLAFSLPSWLRHVPLPCVSTAFVAKALPLPCRSSGNNSTLLPHKYGGGEQSTAFPWCFHCRLSALIAMPFIAVCSSSCLTQCLLLRPICRQCGGRRASRRPRGGATEGAVAGAVGAPRASRSRTSRSRRSRATRTTRAYSSGCTAT